MSHRRAHEGKIWEIGILRQLAHAKAQEDAAFRREVVAQVQTLQARTKEVAHLIKVLEHKINLEDAEANACMDMVHVEHCDSQQQGPGTVSWLKLSHKWYMDRAQEHRDRAHQLTVTKDSLVVAMGELKVSARWQLLLVSQHGRSQSDDLTLMYTSSTLASSTRQSDMKQLALHNNLLTLLKKQMRATYLKLKFYLTE